MTSDPARISVTAKLSAYYRKFSDIAFAAEVATLIGADEAFAALVREHALEPDKLTFYAPMFEARYKSITQLIGECGTTQVLELACGYSLRGLDLTQTRALHYVETDLPEVVATKLELLEDVRRRHDLAPSPSHAVMPADVLELGQLQRAAAGFDRGRPLVILGEGLVGYLTREETACLTRNIHRLLGEFTGGWWIVPDFAFKTELQGLPPERIRLREAVTGLTQRQLDASAFEDSDDLAAFLRGAGFDMQVCSQIDKTPSFSTIAALGLSPAVIERMRSVLRVWLMTIAEPLANRAPLATDRCSRGGAGGNDRRVGETARLATAENPQVGCVAARAAGPFLCRRWRTGTVEIRAGLRCRGTLREVVVMSEYDSKRPTRDRPGASTSGAATAPGKHTLVEQAYETEAPVQREASTTPAGLDPGRVHEAAQHGTSGGGGSLPHLAQIQRSFGRHDVSGVTAHTDARAAEGTRAMGAEAFASGEQVAFGGAPSLHTAAHEAAHVVQQRGGVQLKGGVGEAGDPHEQHANAVADLVVQGKPAESLLDRYAGGGGARGGAIQRLATNFGKFDTTKYDKIGPAGSEYGVDMKLTFDPDVTKVDATKIGMTQTLRSQLAGTAFPLYPSERERMVGKGVGQGAEIDLYGGGPYGNPLYAADTPTGKEKNLGQTPTVASWGQHGWAYKDAKGGQHHQIAKLNDSPSLPGRAKNAAQEFESTALAVEGKQAGTYMGSVSWGWTTDGAGKFTQKPLTLVSTGNPSKGFIAAAKQWNSVANFGNVKAARDPTNVYDGTMSSVAFTIAKGTNLTIVNGVFTVADETFDEMKVASGKQVGKRGFIKVNDMKDVGGATPVLKLPIP